MSSIPRVFASLVFLTVSSVFNCIEGDRKKCIAAWLNCTDRTTTLCSLYTTLCSLYRPYNHPVFTVQTVQPPCVHCTDCTTTLCSLYRPYNHPVFTVQTVQPPCVHCTDRTTTLCSLYRPYNHPVFTVQTVQPPCVHCTDRTTTLCSLYRLYNHPVFTGGVQSHDVHSTDCTMALSIIYSVGLSLAMPDSR